MTSDDIIEFKGDRNEYKHFIERNKSNIIFIKFHASWCKPCKACHNDVLRLYSEYKQKATKQTKLVLIDIDESPDISRFMRVSSVPTFYSYIDGRPHNVIKGARELKIIFS